jgi:hypothetical protein
MSQPPHEFDFVPEPASSDDEHADIVDAPAVEPGPHRSLDAVSLISLVNDPELHRLCVSAARTAAAANDVSLQVIAVECDRHGWNAARGLNAGLERARHRWALCIHQDVMLTPRWFDSAEASIAALRGPSPAVWGTVGVRTSGRFLGAVRDPNGACRWGRPPDRVIALDEHLLLVDRQAGLRFDPRVPGFHCYGTDLAIRARLAGRDAAVLDAPVVHLSTGRLDPAFRAAGDWMLERWGSMFDDVIPTPAATIQRTRRSNSVRRRIVASHRQIAVRMRRTRQRLGGRWAMPEAARADLARSISGLPDSVATALGGQRKRGVA